MTAFTVLDHHAEVINGHLKVTLVTDVAVHLFLVLTWDKPRWNPLFTDQVGSIQPHGKAIKVGEWTYVEDPPMSTPIVHQFDYPWRSQFLTLYYYAADVKPPFLATSTSLIFATTLMVGPAIWGHFGGKNLPSPWTSSYAFGSDPMTYSSTAIGIPAMPFSTALGVELPDTPTGYLGGLPVTNLFLAIWPGPPRELAFGEQWAFFTRVQTCEPSDPDGTLFETELVYSSQIPICPLDWHGSPHPFVLFFPRPLIISVAAAITNSPDPCFGQVATVTPETVVRFILAGGEANFGSPSPTAYQPLHDCSLFYLTFTKDDSQTWMNKEPIFPTPKFFSHE